MLLGNKNAVIYGAGGHIGSTFARAFAREGAKVFLAGRTLSKLEALAEEIAVALHLVLARAVLRSLSLACRPGHSPYQVLG